MWVPEEDLRRVRSEGGHNGGGLEDGTGSIHRGEAQTLGTLLQCMTTHLGETNRHLIENGQQYQEQTSRIVEIAQQNTQTHALIRDQNQMLRHQNQMLQQIILRIAPGLAAGLAEHTMYEFPLEQAPAVPALTETAEAIEATITDSVAIPPLALPNTLKNLSTMTVFRGWYLKGYKHLLSNKANIRSHFKFVVEYLNLFLDEHIPKMPENRQLQTAWRQMVNEKTEVVWKRALNFARENGGGNLSEKVTSFKKFMSSCDHKNLPNNPSGECHFHPDKEMLRDREGLLKHRDEQRSKRRKAVQDEINEVEENQSDAEQAHGTTQATLSEIRVPQPMEEITLQEIEDRRNQRFSELHNLDPPEYTQDTPSFQSADEGYRGVSLSGRGHGLDDDEM